MPGYLLPVFQTFSNKGGDFPDPEAKGPEVKRPRGHEVAKGDERAYS